MPFKNIHCQCQKTASMRYGARLQMRERKECHRTPTTQPLSLNIYIGLCCPVSVEQQVWMWHTVTRINAAMDGMWNESVASVIDCRRASLAVVENRWPSLGYYGVCDDLVFQGRGVKFNSSMRCILNDCSEFNVIHMYIGIWQVHIRSFYRLM